MLLKNHLEKCTKEQLLAEAKGFQLKNYSKLKKAELIECIVESFCGEEMLRRRLSCLTDEQLLIFRKAMETPQEISYHEVTDGIQLYRYWTGFFEEETDRFSVFEDVAEAFKKIDDEDFRRDQSKKGWLMKCITFFISYYGVAPVEVIHQLYRLKVKGTQEEMTDLLWGMPVDIVESCIFPVEGLGIGEEHADHPAYSATGLLIHIPILENKEFGKTLEQQADKEFYIPSIQQIEEICRIGYEESSLSYRKLKTFFMKKLEMREKQATAMCLQTWVDSYEGEGPAKVMKRLSEMGIVFENEKQINEVMSLLTDAYNNTRMKENRGHKPNEIVRKDFTNRTPTVVPESSQAAELLKDVAPGLQEMGITVDLNGNAQTIPLSVYPNGLNGNVIHGEKKIYPNDPCPCGSGKKYKKCCGRG